MRLWLGCIPHSSLTGKLWRGTRSTEQTRRTDYRAYHRRNMSAESAECLNLFVAQRLWKDFWCAERVSLEVRAGGIAALQLVLRLTGSSQAMNKIARELALHLGDASFRPDMVVHTPGVASIFADSLSRKFVQVFFLCRKPCSR